MGRRVMTGWGGHREGAGRKRGATGPHRYNRVRDSKIVALASAKVRLCDIARTLGMSKQGTAYVLRREAKAGRR